MLLRLPWLLSRKRLALAVVVDGTVFSLVYGLGFQLRFGRGPGLSLALIGLLLFWLMSSYVVGRYHTFKTQGLDLLIDQASRGAAVLLLTLGTYLGYHWFTAAAVGVEDRRGFLLPVLLAFALLSGLAHPVIGPDHLAFLLALSLLGLRHRRGWMLSLLTVGLLGTLLGLVLPGLPGAEPLLAATLALEAVVLLGWLPPLTLVPAMALHGYGLSASVLGWSAMPVSTYLLGLVISQGLLLLAALALLRPLVAQLKPNSRPLQALLLLGLAGALGLAAQVG